MKTLMFAISLLVFAVAVSGQANTRYSVKLKGVGLGSDSSAVLKAFGLPNTDKITEDDECRGGKTRTLVYEGIEFEMHESPYKDNEFYVGSISITSAKWVPFGLKTGSSSAAVGRKLGKPSAQETDEESGELVWFYSFDESESPGHTNFSFIDGKVVRITTFYIC